MNIQFVRLEHDICDRINELARDRGQTVSDLVNEILRRQLQQPAAGAADAKPAK